MESNKLEKDNFKMLEIKNVTKVYKTKGGVNTRALDDVSISFGETGLVFLLGKSGSGKSTLLNVSGGLDEPTSGEIIVKGKSSKHFSGSDFDSYRNTFVGFIFQEYNILDEFNVEDNIALALELQGKPKDKEKINELLREVELEKFAKRKPNTLSGGQKQRIAIARALIKEPQIIMADEPTGALDSATGKQVFDTLKKLSETRLVIVVSHDREFAEIYGDRIVELKDGKIISDVSKKLVPPKTLDENITVIGENTLSIKSGATLTAANFAAIQSFIKTSGGDVIISNGEAEISSFKRANRMSESGEAEKFEDTPPNVVKDKEYTAEQSKFIRSRLPAAKALKIGASGLKLKPVRLVFTILLSFVAFTMFGLFSTLMVYDGDKVMTSSFVHGDYDYLNLAKAYEVRYNDGYTGNYEAKFDDEEVGKFRTEFGNDAFGYYTSHVSIANATVKDTALSDYYATELTKFAYLPSGNGVLQGFTGAYPKTTDEIAISSYTLEVLKNAEFYVSGDSQTSIETVKVNSASDVIGKSLTLSLGGRTLSFKVTGVFESGAISAKYDDIKNADGENWMLTYEYSSYLAESMHTMALVSENFYEEYKSLGFFNTNIRYVNYFKTCYNQLMLYFARSEFDFNSYDWNSADDYEMSAYEINAYGSDNQLPTHFIDGKERTVLADDEIVVDLSIMNYVDVVKIIRDMIASGDTDGLEGVDDLDPDDPYYENYLYNCANENANSFFAELGIYSSGSYYDYDENTWAEASTARRNEARQNALEWIDRFGVVGIRLTIDGFNGKELKIVGVYTKSYEQMMYGSSGIYFSENFIAENLEIEQYDNSEETNFVYDESQIYDGMFINFDRTERTFTKLLGMLSAENKQENDVFYTLNNVLASTIDLANSMAETLSTVFLWVGVVFAVFSALLMFNFISVSISNKRKEIGILRAVGARGVDVFKIFFSEAGIIIGICTVLALLGTFGACVLINGILKTELGIGITMFVFGIASVGMMIAIAVVVAFVATFLPVYFASRKKPVDSIRAL